MATSFQVLADFQGAVTPAKDRLTQMLQRCRASASVERGMMALLQKPVADAAAAAGAAPLELEAACRKDNEVFGYCVDAQLRYGARWGLVEFLPKRRLGLLSGDETREFEMHPDALTKELRRRSVIKSVGKGTKVFEIPALVKAGVRRAPTWHVCADWGPVGRYFIQWFIQKAGARATSLGDRFHRIINDLTEAECEAGLSLEKAEWSAVLKTRVGPFGKFKNHQICKAAAGDLRKIANHRNPVFRMLFESIARELSMWDHPQRGEEPHYDAVWEALMDKLVNCASGTELKNNRWWAFSFRGRTLLEKQGGTAGLLFLLVFIGWTRKWWSCIDDCPLLQRMDVFLEEFLEEVGGDGSDEEEGAPEVVPDDPDADEDAEEEADVAEGRVSRTEALRIPNARKRQAGHLLKYAVSVAARPLSCMLLKVLLYLPSPLESAFNSEIRDVKTVWGSGDLQERLHQGYFQETMHALMVRTLSAEYAKLVGFTTGQRLRSDILAKQYDTVATKSWKFCVALVGSLGLSNLHFELMPPLIFNSLVSPDGAVHNATLAQCKRTTEVLRALQQEARGNDGCRSFLTNCVFPQQQWVLEMLGRMEEEQFVGLKFGLREDVQDYRDCMKTSLVLEEGFGTIRREERGNLNGRMGAAAAYYSFARSGLLATHDRRPAPITTAAKSAAPTKLSPQVFEFQEGVEDECSMPEGLVQTIREKVPSWGNLNTTNERLAALRWAAAMDLGGDYTLIKVAWQALLCEPGIIIRRKETPEYLLVLRTSAYALLCVVVTLEPFGVFGYRLKLLPCIKPGKFKTVTITGHQDWLAISLMAVYPPHPRFDAEATLLAINVITTGPEEELQVHAARAGFGSFTLFYLREMYKMAGIKHEKGAKKPTTKEAIARALTKHYLPALTDPELDKIMELREAPPPDPDSLDTTLAFEPTVLESLIDELGDDDGLADALLKAAQRREELDAQKKAAKEMMKRAVPPPPAPPELQKIEWKEGRGLTQPEAKRYAPPGCTLRKRVKVKEWGAAAAYMPISANKRYTENLALEDNDALVYCLQMAWHSYRIHNGEGCPWELRSDLF